MSPPPHVSFKPNITGLKPYFKQDSLYLLTQSFSSVATVIRSHSVLYTGTGVEKYVLLSAKALFFGLIIDGSIAKYLFD